MICDLYVHVWPKDGPQGTGGDSEAKGLAWLLVMVTSEPRRAGGQDGACPTTSWKEVSRMRVQSRRLPHHPCALVPAQNHPLGPLTHNSHGRESHKSDMHSTLLLVEVPWTGGWWNSQKQEGANPLALLLPDGTRRPERESPMPRDLVQRPLTETHQGLPQRLIQRPTLRPPTETHTKPT